MRRTREEREKVARIRELFLSPRKTYSPADAANLTGTDFSELEQQIEKGHVPARRFYELAVGIAGAGVRRPCDQIRGQEACVTPAEAVRLLFHDYAVDVRARHTTEVDAEFPGFAEALFFPDKPWED